jgi:hypothetical protein
LSVLTLWRHIPPQSSALIGHICSNWSVTDTFSSIAFRHWTNSVTLKIGRVRSFETLEQLITTQCRNPCNKHDNVNGIQKYVCMWVMERCYLVLKEMFVCVCFLSDLTEGQFTACSCGLCLLAASVLVFFHCVLGSHINIFWLWWQIQFPLTLVLEHTVYTRSWFFISALDFLQSEVIQIEEDIIVFKAGRSNRSWPAYGWFIFTLNMKYWNYIFFLFSTQLPPTVGSQPLVSISVFLWPSVCLEKVWNNNNDDNNNNN